MPQSKVTITYPVQSPGQKVSGSFYGSVVKTLNSTNEDLNTFGKVAVYKGDHECAVGEVGRVIGIIADNGDNRTIFADGTQKLRNGTDVLIYTENVAVMVNILTPFKPGDNVFYKVSTGEIGASDGDTLTDFVKLDGAVVDKYSTTATGGGVGQIRLGGVK